MQSTTYQKFPTQTNNRYRQKHKGNYNYNLVMFSSTLLLVLIFLQNIFLTDIYGSFVSACAYLYAYAINFLKDVNFADALDHAKEVLSDDAFFYLLNIILSVIIMLIPIIIIKKFDKSPLQTKPKKIDSERSFSKYWFFIVFTMGFGFLINFIMFYVFEDSVFQNTDAVLTLPDSTISILLFYVLISIIPAIFEEIVFRGVILPALLPLGKGFSVLVSAFLFGVMHVDPPRIVFAFTFGVLTGVLYLHTKTIWYGVLIHFINNAYATTAIFQSYNLNEDALTPIDILFSLSALFMIVCGVIGFFYFKHKGLFRFNGKKSIAPPRYPRRSFKSFTKLISANVFTYIFLLTYGIILYMLYFI